jgi:uncharacterized protein (TIGR02145 family)
MKKYIITIILSTLAFQACQQNVEWVTPTWAEAIYPEEGFTVKIDFFQPDSTKVFKWRLRENASYKILFDIGKNFPNPKTFDMGRSDSLKITNRDLLAVLKELDPGFNSISRFFWKVEETRNGETVSTWRYFDAQMLVEAFTDARDGEIYHAEQFIMNDGSLMTIMSENLRATKYADGSPLPVAPLNAAFSSGQASFLANYPAFASDEFKKLAGKYYTWTVATRLTWDEAKIATQANQKIQGVCPNGWHLPSAKEIDAFRKAVGQWSAEKLKHPQYWPIATGITNSAKMNIVCAGYFSSATATSLNNGPAAAGAGDRWGGFWTSSPSIEGSAGGWDTYPLTEDRPGNAAFFLMQDGQGNLVFWGPGTGIAAPCRCIMDN